VPKLSRTTPAARGAALSFIAFGALLVAAASLALVARPAASQGSVRLIKLPSGQLAKCTASPPLRSACPRLVPRVDGRYPAYFARDGTLVPALHVFDLEYFVATLAPPRGAHLTVAAGAVERLTPYADPTDASDVHPLSDSVRKGGTQSRCRSGTAAGTSGA
jgi:hypothetical protein